MIPDNLTRWQMEMDVRERHLFFEYFPSCYQRLLRHWMPDLNYIFVEIEAEVDFPGLATTLEFTRSKEFVHSFSR